MRQLSKKARLIFFLAVLLCGVSFVLLLLSLYFVTNLESSLTQIRVDTKRGQDERQQLSALELLAKNTSDERARLASYIVPDQGVIAFLALVESVARAHRVVPNTESIATSPLQGEILFEALEVKLSLSGSLPNIQAVIAQYESLPYQVRINDLSMGTGGQGGSAELTLIVTKMKP